MIDKWTALTNLLMTFDSSDQPRTYEIMKRVFNMKGHLSAIKMKKGDPVEYIGSGSGKLFLGTKGTIVNVNRVNIVVDFGIAGKWNVKPQALKALKRS